jgi:hypothetical protein
MTGEARRPSGRGKPEAVALLKLQNRNRFARERACLAFPEFGVKAESSLITEQTGVNPKFTR